MADVITLSSTITARVAWNYRNNQDESGRYINDANNVSFSQSVANGDAINQAELIWTLYDPALSIANHDYDLAGGVTDSFGRTLTFAAIKGIYVHNGATDATGIITVGGAANAIASYLGAANDTIKVGPGGVLLLWNPSLAGYAVTGGSADELRITVAGVTIPTTVVVIGISA